MRAWMIAGALALAACNATDDPEPEGGAASGGKGGNGSAGTAVTAGGTGGKTSSGDCEPCIDTLSWGFNGGFVAFTDESSLGACNTYRHTRTSAADPGRQAETSCERPIPCMGSGLHGIADVLQALQAPAVDDAFAEGTVLFGNDPRAFDGSVFRISNGRSSVEIGTDCTGDPGCMKTPAAVTELMNLLQAIDDEQLHIEPCNGKFQ